MPSTINIRPARKQDLPDIIELVKELAVFEKENDAVTAQLKEYEEAYDSGLIASHVALDGSRVIGMTLYYNTFSTWKGPMLYLEDFYVKPEYRSKGVGSLLWDALVDVANERRCALIKWEVLDWNTDAIRFYKRKNAEIDDTWYNGRLWLR